MGLNDALPCGATPLDADELNGLGLPRFSWGGSSSLVDSTTLRSRYITALQQADRGDLEALLSFARAR